MHQIMGPAIAARIFPGCVILAARGGRVLHHAAYGSTMYDDPGTRPVAPDDSFDLASLTQLWVLEIAVWRSSSAPWRR